MLPLCVDPDNPTAAFNPAAPKGYNKPDWVDAFLADWQPRQGPR